MQRESILSAAAMRVGKSWYQSLRGVPVLEAARIILDDLDTEPNREAQIACLAGALMAMAALALKEEGEQ